ncbi:MAG: hypothetical protein NTV54_12005 [Ignavibacteriales bacterium]|nr:hypothetical protein [Ignavibacteriales bacterium]
MTIEEFFPELEALAEQMDVRIRYEKGDFDGGYCILRDERIIVVNRRLNVSRKVSVISQGLNQLGLDNVFIKPAVRLCIEDELAKAR